MDQFYVTADGQIAQLPRRSFLDRLTSGLYDASVEYRKPGGGQEARLARTQPLTSALNQYGQQRREFDQQNSVLDRRQGFEAGQSTLDRELRTKLAADELAQQKALAEARLAQDKTQFQATHGLREAERFDKIYEGNRKFATEMENLPYQRSLWQSQIGETLANTSALQQHGGLYEAQMKEAALMATPIPPDAARAIEKDRGMAPGSIPYGVTYGQIRALSTGFAGKSGTIPFELFNNNGAGLQLNTTPGATNTIKRITGDN